MGGQGTGSAMLVAPNLCSQYFQREMRPRSNHLCFFTQPRRGAGARSKQLQGRVHLELSAGVATGLGVEAGIHIVVLIVAVVVVGPGAMEPRTKGRFGDGNGWTRGTRCRRGSSDAHHVFYD